MKLLAVTGALLLLSACRPRPPIEAPQLPVVRQGAAQVDPAPALTGAKPVAPVARPRVEESLPPGETATDEDAGAKARKFIAEINSRLRDAYFDYDRAVLCADTRQALEFDYQLLRGLLADFPKLQIIVEGHCDEHGSAEYNLGLGDRRANLAIQYLAGLGLPEAKLRPVSFGKERPQCTEPEEACWEKNRRAHLVVVDAF